jgi:large repetitive protein
MDQRCTPRKQKTRSKNRSKLFWVLILTGITTISSPFLGINDLQAATLSTNPNDWVSPIFRDDQSMQNLNIPADAASQGMWSAPFDWPMNGLHNMILPDGKVLTFGTNSSGNTQDGRLYDVWDPYTGFNADSHNSSYQAQQQDSFCATAAYLNDGTLLVTGGNANNGGYGNGSTIYDPVTNTRTTAAATTALPRWYATMITLPDSSKLTMGGMVPYTEGMVNDPESAIASGYASMTPEIYEDNQWRSLFGASSRDAFGPDFLRTSFPHAFVAPNGLVFGISADKMWYMDTNANNGKGAITYVADFKPGQGNKADPDNVGALSVAVMYDIGKVIQVGGNGGHNGDGLPASNKATAFDINGEVPVLTELPRMTNPRRYGNGIVLANGQVVVTGGTTFGNYYPGAERDAGSQPVYAVEIWDPDTNTWTIGADASTIRVYHSISSLLLNGAIISTGGGTPGPVLNKTGEIYYPPYLFENIDGVSSLAQRPKIEGISGLKYANGAALQFDMSNEDTVESVVLIGLSNGTHSFNSGQRRIPVDFVQQQNRITTSIPGANLTPPGYYQVVVLNSKGVPSYGVVIAIGDQMAAPNVASKPYTPVSSDVDSDGDGTLDQFDAFPNDPTETTDSDGDGTGDNSDPTPFGDTPQDFSSAWSFDDASGNIIEDASSANLNLTASNMTWVDGVSGQAGQFNGVNSQATLGEALIDTAGTFSISAWVKLDALTGWRTIVNQDGVNVSGFWLQYSEYINGGKFLLTMHEADKNSAAFRAVSTTTPVVGQWYHLVGVRDKANNLMKLYVNGNLESTITYTGGWTANGPLNVGRGRWYGPNDWFAGVIDSVSIYNTVLNDSQILSLYYAGVATLPPMTTNFNKPIINAGEVANYDLAATAGYQYSWNFGDGSTETAFDTTPDASHSYTAPGLYLLSLRTRDPQGIIKTQSWLQAVAMDKTAQAPNNSSPIALDNDGRIWTVNPDNNSVSVLSATNDTLIQEIQVGMSPRTIAKAPDGKIWVTNKHSATISVINPDTLEVVQTIALPRASKPHGIAFAPDGSSAYVALEATGQLIKLNASTQAQQGLLTVGQNVRHVAVSADSATVLVSRFITPPLPGESTLKIDTTSQGGEVIVVDATTLSINKTIMLQHSDKADNSIQGSGIPNYLAAAVISPDGTTAWVPSKQDNIKRGMGRSGQNLDFQNTVRAISSRINMQTLNEDYAQRIDHDNAGVASAAVYHTSGAYLFVALETSREVAVLNAFKGTQLFRVDVGRAPQGLALSADGNTLYVHEFMDRSVTAFDLRPLTEQGQLQLDSIATTKTVINEKLAANVLSGKQLFYDAKDIRIARDGYMSCASCHNDSASDGRVWDLTGFGEGLRNTITLKGRASTGHGFLHWSANFDELQDFEKQIRDLAGGTGLMTDDDYNAGTRNQSLGDKKAGLSEDLDDLASFVASLNSFDQSPKRNPDGTLTSAATAGKTVFKNNCASCHGGSNFTISSDASQLKDVGTINEDSGKRLNDTLDGFDVPTLRDVWATAPYLHNGSAPTITAAVQAHNNVALNPTDLANVVAYVQQIGSEEVVVRNSSGSWSFNESSANVVADASGNNHPITLSNTTWVTGVAGQAVQLNGKNASGSTTTPIVDTSKSFTVSAWVKLDNLYGWQTFVNQDGANVSGFWLQYSQYVNNNKFVLSMHDVDSTASRPYRAVSTTTPVTGQWYHLVGVRDKASGTMKLYVDGKLEGTTAYTGGWAANGSLNVGRGKYGRPNDWVAGSIDEVSAYDSALSDAEVASLYQAGGAGNGVETPPTPAN